MFGYTLIKTKELEEIKSERDKYFNKWIEEVFIHSEFILRLEERKKNEL